MTALITASNSEGVQGRCDAKCYNAKPGSACDCICGGRNHAAGIDKALDNTAELAEVMIAEHKAAHAGRGANLSGRYSDAIRGIGAPMTIYRAVLRFAAMLAFITWELAGIVISLAVGMMGRRR